MRDIALVYTTLPDREAAVELADQLIRLRLAACTHIFPVESSYRWDNKIEKDDEYILRAKTLAIKYEELIQKIEELHSYDVPMIQTTRCQVNIAYYRWMQETMNSDED